MVNFADAGDDDGRGGEGDSVRDAVVDVAAGCISDGCDFDGAGVRVGVEGEGGDDNGGCGGDDGER